MNVEDYGSIPSAARRFDDELYPCDDAGERRSVPDRFRALPEALATIYVPQTTLDGDRSSLRPIEDVPTLFPVEAYPLTISSGDRCSLQPTEDVSMPIPDRSLSTLSLK